jgi:hypothetical protein
MRILFTLVWACMATQLMAQSPITLSRADFPRPTSSSPLPDSVLFTNVPTVGNTVDITTTGANSLWMMSPLVNGTTAWQNFIPMSATPLIFQLAFLSCDYAQPLLGNAGAVGNLPLSDAYEYYNYATGDSRLEIKGFGANISLSGVAVPLPALYTSPDVLYKFPIHYGDADSSVSGFSLTVPFPAPIGNVDIKRNQKRVNHVDGWGTITTPAGTFDVLRVYSAIDRIDSVITSFVPLGFASKPVEIKWVGQAKKIPVFQVNGNLTGTTVAPTSITFWGASPEGLPQAINEKSLAIFPNPASQQAYIEYQLHADVDVDMYLQSVTGKQVAEFHFQHQAAGVHQEFLPLHSLPAGVYVVRCMAGHQMVQAKLLKLD